ncbi:hypothetical protein RND81_08G184000 [Saponaria officinalis]|uniref:Uncharacterized protein n=1 Tax=Saponaria officinalis TaxID=3572 RepID=A0AAW1J918_SAPOF
MTMNKSSGIKQEQNLEQNEPHIISSSDDEKDEIFENNDKQIVLYNPKNVCNDDGVVVSGKEIVPISISDPIPDPDPLQCRPLSVPKVLPSVGAFTVQCALCYKWRLIPSKEKYEEIREHIMDRPFSCDLAKEWRAEISCDEPADIEQDGSRLWAIDKPSIAQPPLGWERELRIRGEGSSKFADVYYISPTGKRLRSMVEVHKYLMEHPDYIRQGVTLSQFSFQTPKPLQENYVRKRAPRVNATSGDPVHASPLSWASPDNPTALQLGEPSLSASYSRGSSNDVTPSAQKKSRPASDDPLSSNDSFHHQPKRFKIKGPSPPPNEFVDL